MKTLREIYDTETTLGSNKWDSYFEIYEMYFQKYVSKSPVVVEVGVQGGGCLQMWRKYFGDGAKIIGIDIDPRVLEHQKHFQNEDTTIVMGNQESPYFWNNFLQKYPDIDVFIDDGGHSNTQQIVTFENVFPHITNGGTFLCEDTHCSYEESIHNPNSFIEYVKELTDLPTKQFIKEFQLQSQVNLRKQEIAKGIKSVCFHNSIVVMQKGLQEAQLTFVNYKDNKIQW